MKIICDANMPLGRTLFQSLGDVTLLPPHRITPGLIADADMLFVRTQPVNDKLLGDCRLRFLGTTSASLDHLDLNALSARGIQWCHSPGVAATSVADYTISALLEYARMRQVRLEGKIVGVYGMGSAGSLIAQRYRALGMQVFCCDDPRKANPEDTEAQAFVSFDDMIAQADFISLHAPLIREGQYANYHLLNHDRLASAKYGAVLINMGRGGVTDKEAVLHALKEGILSDAIIDVWEDEPDFCVPLAERAFLATPHLAGLAYESRANASYHLYTKACEFLGVQPTITPLLPPPVYPRIEFDAYGKSDEEVLWFITQKLSMIVADHMRFMDVFQRPIDQRMREFDAQRRTYPYRREFEATTICLKHAVPSVKQKVLALGFKLEG